MMKSSCIPPVVQLPEPVADSYTATGTLGVRIIFYQPFAKAIEIYILPCHLAVE
jgi:hypothetical protein